MEVRRMRLWVVGILQYCRERHVCATIVYRGYVKYIKESIYDTVYYKVTIL